MSCRRCIVGSTMIRLCDQRTAQRDNPRQQMASAAGSPTSNLPEEDVIGKAPGAKVRRDEDHRRQSAVLWARESFQYTCQVLGKAETRVLLQSRLTQRDGRAGASTSASL